MILAARFALFTGDYESASRIAQKLLESCRSEGPSTPFELEALCIDQWVTVIDAQSKFCEVQSTGNRAIESEIRKKLLQIDNTYNTRSEPEIDSLMMRVRGKQAVKQNGDALNILNQVIIMMKIIIMIVVTIIVTTIMIIIIIIIIVVMMIIIILIMIIMIIIIIMIILLIMQIPSIHTYIHTFTH